MAIAEEALEVSGTIRAKFEMMAFKILLFYLAGGMAYLLKRKKGQDPNILHSKTSKPQSHRARQM